MFAQQSKHRTRDAALIAAALVTGVAPSASGQTLADNATRFPTAVETGVSPVDCAVFRRYILQEAKDFADQMSGTFLTSVSRFTKAGCAARDASGEIQIITETIQDAASLSTAFGRMGKVDIRGLSGVKGCARPPNGICPSKTGGATAPRSGS
jgi:hypothetical protein